MFLSYEELEQVIKNVSRSFAKSFYRMEREDLEQELWILMWKKDPEFEKQAAAICRNYCKDLYRKEKRRNAEIPTGIVSDEDGERQSYNQRISHKYSNEKGFERMEFINKIKNQKNERLRRYAIAKGYLDCDMIELEDEFFKMFDKLDETQKEEITNSKKVTDGMIIKTFLGISGTSSSVCVLKQNARDELFNDVQERDKETVSKLLKKRESLKRAAKKVEDEDQLDCIDGLVSVVDGLLEDLGYRVSLLKKLNKEN